MARRRRLTSILKVGSILIIIAGIGWGISWVSFRPFWNISLVQVSGAVSLHTTDVQEVARNDITGAYGWFISKSNQLFYPRKGIVADIQKKFPQVASVQLAVNDHVLEVMVTERQPAYRWCTAPDFSPTFPDSVAVLTTAQCYFMDDQGYIFMPVPSGTEIAVGSTSPDLAPFRFYGLVDASTTPVNTTYMSPQAFATISTIISSLENQHLSSYALVARPEGVDELFLTQGGILIFTNDEQADQVVTAVNSLQQSTSIFNYGPRLSYVDVRLGTKVFYKLVEQTSSKKTATSTVSLHTTVTSTDPQ